MEKRILIFFLFISFLYSQEFRNIHIKISWGTNINQIGILKFDYKSAWTYPKHIQVNKNGMVFVPDDANGYIKIYSSKGNLVNSISRNENWHHITRKFEIDNNNNVILYGGKELVKINTLKKQVEF